jgi:hypothetical protein
MIETRSARNVIFLMARFIATFFCKKEFPQGFHSKGRPANTRKPFKKDLFSSQNRCFFEGREDVTLVQTGRLSVRSLAVLAEGAQEGKKGLAKAPKLRPRRFPLCETARESPKRWDRPRAQATPEANRGKTRYTTE